MKTRQSYEGESNQKQNYILQQYKVYRYVIFNEIPEKQQLK